MLTILLLGIGLFAGTLGSLVGLGGGIIVVPALLFVGAAGWGANITPQIAAGTSLFTLIFTGLSSMISYLKKKLVDYQSAWLFMVGIIPGSILGSALNDRVNGDSFYLYFGIWVIFLAVLLMFRDRIKPFSIEKAKIRKVHIDQEGKEHFYGYSLTLVLLLTFLVGFSSGFFGLGGGALMMPVMLLVFRFPPHLAVGTSMMVVFFSALVGSVSHFFLGNINWMYALVLVPGGYLGGKLGAYINMKLKSSVVVLILRIVLILIGIRLVLQGLKIF